MSLSVFEFVLIAAGLAAVTLLGQDVGRRAGKAAAVLGGHFSRSRLKSMTLARLPNFVPSSMYVCGRSGIAIDETMRKLAVTQGRSADILDPCFGLDYRTEERRLAGWDWYYLCLRKNGREFAIPFQDSRLRDEWVRRIVSL
jgi:hypothetical protein